MSNQIKTAEEILSKHVNCLDGYAQKDNMIKAMEEYASQQLAEREKEIKAYKLFLKDWETKYIEQENELSRSEMEQEQLESTIQSLKDEVERISDINRKFIDDCILKATIDKDNRIKELQEEVEGLKKENIELRGIIKINLFDYAEKINLKKSEIESLQSTLTTQAEEIKKLKEYKYNVDKFLSLNFHDVRALASETYKNRYGDLDRELSAMAWHNWKFAFDRAWLEFTKIFKPETTEPTPTPKQEESKEGEK